ncbi:MAG: hypothetical protein WCA30_10020 [Dermatophilaceae bacterium]
MSPTPRLPDLGPADAGRTFVMRPGSQRMLLLEQASPPTVHGEDGVIRVLEQSEREGTHNGCRYRVEAVGSGRVTIRSGEAEWHIEVRGASQPTEQTRDDTDSGWGESESTMSQRWWEEQRPPHW